MTDRDDLLDLIQQAISDSLDADWTSRDGARAVVDALQDAGIVRFEAREDGA